MKYVKMLGLAAVAALALMAVVGVSSAAASAKVCSTTGTGAACAAGHGTEYTTQKFTGTTVETRTAVLLSGFNVVTCHSHIEGEITHGGAGKITSLTFTNCINDSLFGASCTASSNASPTNPWNGTAVAEGGGNGRLEISSEVTGQFTCVSTNCRYKAANAGTKGEIKVTGGETATVTATKVPLALEQPSSESCSATATWSGTYSVTTPDSLWLT